MPGKGDFPRPCRVCRFCSEIAMEARNVKQENPEEHLSESGPRYPENRFHLRRRDAENLSVRSGYTKKVPLRNCARVSTFPDVGVCDQLACEGRGSRGSRPEQKGVSRGGPCPRAGQGAYAPGVKQPPCILVRFEVVASPRRIGAGQTDFPGGLCGGEVRGPPSHRSLAGSALAGQNLPEPGGDDLSFSVLQGLRAEAYRILNVPCDNRRFTSLQLPNNLPCCFWRL